MVLASTLTSSGNTTAFGSNQALFEFGLRSVLTNRLCSTLYTYPYAKSNEPTHVDGYVRTLQLG